MEPEEAMVAVLKADPGVGAVCGDRIYPLKLPRTTSFAPGTADLPAITYQLINEGTPQAGTIRWPHYQVTVFGGTYAAAKSAAKAVRDVLHLYKGAAIRTGAVMGSRDISDPDMEVYMIPIDVRLGYLE